MTLLQSLHTLLPMTMASLSFIYVYLPVSLLIYHILPRTFRPMALLAASLGFYALAQPDHFLTAVASVLTDYAMIWGVVAWKGAIPRRLFLWACVVKNVAMIVYFGISTGGGMPLGLNVICVSGIDCALEAYREEYSGPRGFIHVAAYILFFPRLYAGPVVRYGEFSEGLGKTGFDGRGAATGFGRFAGGILKYAIIGREMFWLYNSLRVIPSADASVLSAWILALSFMLSLYFTLSGLSDMARGIAGMFGLALPQNFYYPYQSRSVTDFFERFNMTAGSFLKRAVLDPLKPRGDDPVALVLNLLLAGMLWGIWFGFRTNFIIWGAFTAVFIIMEKYLYPRVLEACPTLFRRGYAFCVAIAGFVIFAGDTPEHSMEHLRMMLRLGSDGVIFINDRIRYVLSSNWAVLILSCALATNLVSLVVDFIRRSLPRVSWVLFGAASAGILAIFTIITLGGGYV